MKISGDRHVDDLTADEMRLRFLGPGKFIDCQIDFKTHLADRPNNSTVGKRKGIESSREKSHFGRPVKAKSPLIDAVLRQKTFDVCQCGGPVEEGQAVLIR